MSRSIVMGLILLLAGATTRPNAAASAAQRASSATTDSVEAHARAVLSISEFFIVWQSLWRESELRRAQLADRSVLQRLHLPYVHCHPGVRSSDRPARASDAIGRPFSQFPLVESDHSYFSACPTWILGASIPEASDEALWRDGALVPSLRAAAAAARSTLIASLDSAMTAWPGSTFLTGQLVRFHVDQRNFDSAEAATRRCRATAWWCLGLRAYVVARRGDVVEADSLFAHMRAAMPSAERCRWVDVRAVLPPADTVHVGKKSCADLEKESLRFWWLSDPLYRIRGNDRLVIHETRRMEIELHRALDADDRHPWRPQHGGDAMMRLITRYGRPTYTAWGGANVDASHSGYLTGYRSVPVPPYTTMEYSIERIHLTPTWTAAQSPFRMQVTDWALADETVDGAIDPRWWPHEHVPSTRRLVQLPEGQTAMFRRQSHIALATAHQLQHPLAKAAAQQFDVMLLSTKGADRVDSLDQRVARGGQTMVLQSPIAPEPQLVAVEAIGVGSTVDARIRYGIAPPPPLSAMAAGEIAISDPALIDVRDPNNRPPLPDESLLDQLLGTVTIGAKQRRVGLYWETYGVDAGDTVTVTVAVGSDQDISALRRLGMSLNIAADPRRSLRIRWTEPSPQFNTRTLVGPVPVQLRTLVLNLSQLAPGPYVLTVGIERPGSASATSQRRIVIAP